MLTHQTAAVGRSFGLTETASGNVSVGAAKHTASRENVDVHSGGGDDQAQVESLTARHSEVGSTVIVGALWQLGSTLDLHPSYQHSRFDHGGMNKLSLEGRLFIAGGFGFTFGFDRREWGAAEDRGRRLVVVIRF